MNHHHRVQIHNFTFLLIFLLGTLVTTGCVQTPTPSPQNMVKAAGDVDSTSAACSFIVAELDKRIPLQGKSIQIVDSNITYRQTGSLLPYSKILGDGFAREFSKLGAKVTVRRLGTESLILLASYNRSGKMVIIDAKLREVQANMNSQEVAIAEAAVPVASVDSEALEPSLKTQTDLLNQQLAANYTGGAISIQYGETVPGKVGEPTLQFGNQFGAALKESITSNQLLPVSLFGGRPVTLNSSYTLVQDEIILKAWLITSKGKILSQSSAALPKKKVSPDMLKPIATSSTSACIRYVQGDGNNLAPNSQEAVKLSGIIRGYLHELAIQPDSCSAESEALQVISTITQLSTVTTQDDYKFSQIAVRVVVLDSNGSQKGEFNEQAAQPFTSNQTGANLKAVEKVTQKGLKDLLAKALLSRGY